MEEKQKDQSPPPQTETTHPTPHLEIQIQSPLQTPEFGTATIHQTPPSTQPLLVGGLIGSYASQIGSIFNPHPSHSEGICQHHQVSSITQPCITRQQKHTPKFIEKKRHELQEEECRLENDGNRVMILIATILLLYILVFGGGIVINGGLIVAYITSNKNEKTLMLMILATVFTFVVGIGMPIFLAFQNIKRLNWKSTIVQQQRVSLKSESEKFRSEIHVVTVGIEDVSVVNNASDASSLITQESANTRIATCIDSLGSDYFYHGYMFYVIFTGVIAAAFFGIMVAFLVFSYNKDSDLAARLEQPFFGSSI